MNNHFNELGGKYVHKKIVLQKAILSLVICCLCLLGITGNVRAYQVLGYRWPSSTITYSFSSGMAQRAQAYTTTCAGMWNSSDATLTQVSSGYNVWVSTVSYSDAEWDGLTDLYLSGGYFTGTAYLRINAGATETWNDNGALRSVVLHEFGHCLGLADLEGERAIMNGFTWGNYSRYGAYGLTTLQNDDLAGVNSIY